MGPALRQQLYALARIQHGVVAMNQARQLAGTGALRREFESERWCCIVPGVHAVAGMSMRSRSMAMARLLRCGPGALVSHESALALWGVPGMALAPLHVTRVRHSNGLRPRQDGVITHETRLLPAHHTTVHESFATVTPSRALADIAATASHETVERLLDQAWSQRLVNHETLRSVVADLSRRGRAGIGVLAALVTERGPSHAPAPVEVERRLNSLLGRQRPPMNVRPARIGGSPWLGRVDFVVQSTRLVIEVRNRQIHGSLSDVHDDAARRQRLHHAGFDLAAIWDDDLARRPDIVTQVVQTAIGRAA